MHLDPRLVPIKVSEIEEISWLHYRRTSDDKARESQALRMLGNSLTPPVSGGNGRPSQPPEPSVPLLPPPTRAEDFSDDLLSKIAIGQLSAIRVIRFPSDLIGHKPYGLVFGYRRWEAAKLKGLPTLDAQVLILTSEEYRSERINLLLRLMAIGENEHREPLSARDRMFALKDCLERFQLLYPNVAPKRGRPASAPSAVAKSTTPAAESASAKRSPHPTSRSASDTTPTPRPGSREHFLVVASKVTNRSKKTIERDLYLADLLSRSLYTRMLHKNLTPKALSQLVRLPEKQQIDLLRRTPKSTPITTATIRAELAKQSGTDPLPAAHPLAPRPVCHHCKTCRITDAPADCPQVSTIIAQLQIAAVLCSDLNLHFKWTPLLRDLLLPHLSRLATAAQTLEGDLRNPERCAKIHPEATVALVPPGKSRTGGPTR